MILLTEKMETVRSVSLGIWVRAGSRDETDASSGISHFLEHMFFKGTETRSALDIAIDIDSLGGELNAFTSKEGTTFYIKVLDDFLDKGIDLLADIFLNSTLPEDEIEREKGVVVEEIKMTEDTPDDYVHDIFSHASWGDDNIGRPVLGTVSTVESFTRRSLTDYINSRYSVGNTIISCAGNFDEQLLVDKLNGAFSGFDRRIDDVSPLSQARFAPSVRVVHKDLSEAHICIGIEGIRQASEDRYAALVLNTVLGGGISSRLFQEIREKRGLAYSVYSFLSSYLDVGIWGIYAGTSPEKANEVVDICLNEIRSVGSTITEAEVDRARTQLKGNIMLGLESTSRRMQNIANQQLYYGRHYTPEEVMNRINSVTLDDTVNLCRRIMNGKSPTIVALGSVDPSMEDVWRNITI